MQKLIFLFLFALAPAWMVAQIQTQAEVDAIEAQPKPTYCNEPVLAATQSAPASAASPMPQYPTLGSVCYKVQVAILRQTSPVDFAFHPSLTARWRPCEEVWIVETRETFCSRDEAEAFRGRLKELGYSGAFLTKLISYD